MTLSPTIGRFVFTLLIVGVFMFIATSFARITTFTSFAAIFLSLILEGFPFILLGAVVGAIVEFALPPERIASLSRKVGFAGIPIAAVSGFAVPICECAIVPTVRSLRQKGMALPQAVTFMIAVPLLNPIVIASTVVAFPGQPDVLAARFGGGLLVVLTVGFIFFVFDRHRLRDEVHPQPEIVEFERWKGPSFWKRIPELLGHASEEFIEILAIFSLGALLSSLMQVLLPVAWLSLFRDRLLLSILLMIVFAFLLSVCSEADAFIAKAFVPMMPMGGIIAFLVFGPMLDLKNVLLLRRVLSNSELLLLAGVLVTTVTILGVVYGAII